jgi:hypothetical protein
MADQPVPVSDTDWTVDLTNRLETVVGTVRDRTTIPVMKAAEVIIFGFVAAVLAIMALFVLVIALIRLLDSYLPVQPESRRVWIVYGIVAAIFLGAGTFLWRKRLPNQT